MESTRIFRFVGCRKAAVVLVFGLGLALCCPAAGIGDGTPADTMITRGDLEGMVRRYVRQKAPWPAERLRINRIQISGEAQIPPGRPSVEIVAPPNTDFLANQKVGR